jgi:hypothetical protein
MVTANRVIAFTPEQDAALRLYKEKTGCSVSEAVRRAVEDRYVSPSGYEAELITTELETGKAAKC